jgi:hypothetical protein
VVWAVTGGAGEGSGDFAPATSGPDRLVTNEYAHWNPGASDARRSPDWDMTSGSLFVRNGAGWSGPPDPGTPDARSSTGTGSSVFRMNTRRTDFGDVQVTLRIRTLRFVDGAGRAPTAPTDGVHLLLRRHDQTELYAASLNRRDGLLVVKKKLTGGTENGGTYVTLRQVRHPFQFGTWQTFDVRVTSRGRARVTVAVSQNGRRLLEAVDDGAHGPPITRPGSIGLRADNCEFEFQSLRARPLA